MTMTARAEQLHGLLREQSATLAVAESLTGGLVGAELTEVAGASATFLGGVTAYATAAKSTLLDVEQDLLDRFGAVHPQVAVSMADGVRSRFGSTYGLALTGVAGPEPQDGQAPGTVFIACVGPEREEVTMLRVPGGRAEVRAAAARAAVELALAVLASEPAGLRKNRV